MPPIFSEGIEEPRRVLGGITFYFNYCIPVPFSLASRWSSFRHKVPTEVGEIRHYQDKVRQRETWVTFSPCIQGIRNIGRGGSISRAGS